ncbi:MAG: ligand-binding sensor domain-containing protein/signal transduction histidine kinase [Alteromonadaceae bacterium]|jgi:ligand-binding sensor domain-containing protein/signal transduction histidine kinase
MLNQKTLPCGSVHFTSLNAGIKNTLTSCLLAALLMLGSTCQADSYYSAIETLSVEDGLPDSTVYSIAKDETGFLWFGSPTALARYDGYQFRSFSHDDDSDQSLVVDRASNIFIDSKQRLWVGTWGEGLALYDRDMQLIAHFTHEKTDPWSIGSNMVQAIFEDREGDIWIGTNGGGLALYQPQKQSFVSYRFDASDRNSLSHNRIWSITETNKGIIWIGTSDGLNQMDKKSPGKFTRFKHDPNVSTSVDHVLVRALLAGSGGELWVGTEKGFGLFNTKSLTFTPIQLVQSGVSAPITRMIEDNDGGIWIATKSGIFRYNTNLHELTPLVNENSYQLFRHNDIRDILFDDSGVLWVATRYAGLIKANSSSNLLSYYSTYSRPERHKNPINKVYALHSDKKDSLWMGIDEGLLHMNMQTKEISRLNALDNFPSMRINAIAPEQPDKLWIGGSFGLLSVDITTRIFNDESAILAGIGIKIVQSLLRDRRGNLWIGTAHKGLLKLDHKGDVTRYQHDSDNPNSLSNDAIQTLFEDIQGRIWVGTQGGGVNRFDASDSTFVKYLADPRQSGNLSDNVVNVIYQTNDRQMWFGTAKSLDRLDEKLGQFRHYGMEDGLANSNIKGIIEDDFGDMWISTNKGLSQFKPLQKHFSNFSEQDSLQSGQFLAGSVARGNDGVLYFGGNAGIHEVVPSQVKINEHIPAVVITDVWIDDRPADKLNFNSAVPLVIGHEVNSLRFRFAALDFQAPDKNRYSYKLQGLDEHWHEPSEDRTVTYTNLKPGKYTFAVTGSNNSNQWNAVSGNLEVIITPPWWTLWWIKALAVFGVLMLIFSWNRYRLLTIAGQTKLLEVEVSVRTAELNLQKEELIEAHQLLNERTEALENTNEELSLTLKKTAEYQEQLMEEQKMATLGSMAAGISHEINTPIGLGITATTLMQDRLMELKLSFSEEKLSAKQLSAYLREGEESLEIIFRNLEKAAKMIRSFKQVSVDQSREESRNFEILQLINEVLFSLQPDLKKVRHQVEVICDKGIRIKSKSGPIGQILINLINNSLTHAFDGIDKGRMTIKVDITGNHCQLTYRDDGNGVAENIQDHIFEPFVSSKIGSGGTGLGMHLVYNLATQGLGGSISLNKSAEQGIELVMVFPVSIEQEATRNTEPLLN